MNDLGALAISGLLGGGVFKAIESLVSARWLAKKVDSSINVAEAKLPAEVDSVVVQGAEQAVLTMERALAAAERRIKQLERNASEDHRRIAALETRVREAEGKAQAAQAAAADAQHTITELRGELRQFASDRDRRRP